jgi:hypothetical protein
MVERPVYIENVMATNPICLPTGVDEFLKFHNDAEGLRFEAVEL